MKILVDAKALDFDGVFKLMERFGGEVVQVPSRIKDDKHPLAQVLGLERARGLVAFCGGCSPYIPRGARYFLAQRNAEIRREYDAGKTTAKKLGQKFDLTERQVYKILNRPG